MSGIPFALAIGAGMLATVNPCGFAMLPAYLAFFVGQDTERTARTPAASIARALVVTLAVTTGFVAVFGTVGLAVSTIAQSIDDHLPWVTVVIGVSLVGLGVALLTGRSVALALPKLERGGRRRTFTSMFVFGVSYAVASLSCTLPVFLTTLTPTFRGEGVVAGLAAFLLYAGGMGLVLGVVTVATALARATVVARLRRALPLVQRMSGALLAVAGAYVAYYGIWELRGDFGADPVIDVAIDVQSWLSEQVDALPRALLAAILAVAALAALGRRRRRKVIEARGVPAR
jgi:cytochrome c biogenesis protein CcdA